MKRYQRHYLSTSYVLFCILPYGLSKFLTQCDTFTLFIRCSPVNHEICIERFSKIPRNHKSLSLNYAFRKVDKSTFLFVTWKNEPSDRNLSSS